MNTLTPPQYDAFVLKSIKLGTTTFSVLYLKLALELDSAGWTLEEREPTYRGIDRSLQRLRKKGCIRFEKGRWSFICEPSEESV